MTMIKKLFITFFILFISFNLIAKEQNTKNKLSTENYSLIISMTEELSKNIFFMELKDYFKKNKSLDITFDILQNELLYDSMEIGINDIVIIPVKELIYKTNNKELSILNIPFLLNDKNISKILQNRDYSNNLLNQVRDHSFINPIGLLIQDHYIYVSQNNNNFNAPIHEMSLYSNFQDTYFSKFKILENLEGNLSADFYILDTKKKINFDMNNYIYYDIPLFFKSYIILANKNKIDNIPIDIKVAFLEKIYQLSILNYELSKKEKLAFLKKNNIKINQIDPKGLETLKKTSITFHKEYLENISRSLLIETYKLNKE